MQAIDAITVNLGRAWAAGTLLTFIVLYLLSTIRWSPDGVMAFCRSMGVPEVEEYMFSYSWKCEEESVRTLAKAVWNSGVGVWIDVVKLFVNLGFIHFIIELPVMKFDLWFELW